MAWIDDRIWCHPKLADVSKPARWGFVAGICYSSGFQTRGQLTNGQITQIGIAGRERLELVQAGLWHETQGGIEINDWGNHNSSRDDKRAKDRERKRRQRNRERPPEVTRDTPVTNSVTKGGTSRPFPQAEEVKSEGSDLRPKSKSKTLGLAVDNSKLAEIRAVINTQLGEAK